MHEEFRRKVAVVASKVNAKEKKKQKKRELIDRWGMNKMYRWKTCEDVKYTNPNVPSTLETVW